MSVDEPFAKISSLTAPWTLELGLTVAITALMAMVLALWLRARLTRFHRHRIAVKRSARAQRGERRAEILLQRAGYRIVERQLRTQTTLLCNGEELRFDLRADLLVERHGVPMIAEVKTGERAPDLSNSATRRQLLEYALAYRCPHLLLVDVENGEIHDVSFDLEFVEEALPSIGP